MLSVATRVGAVALNAAAAYLTYDALTQGSKAAPTPSLSGNTKEIMTIGGVLVTAGLAYGAYKRRGNRQMVVRKSKSMLSPESIRAESELTARTVPPCQVTLAMKNGDALEPVGCGIRTQYGIWTLDHVIANLDRIWLIKGEKQVELDLKKIQMTHFALESVCLKVSENDMSTLGLQVAKFGPLPKDGKLVIITGPYGQGSMGRLIRTRFGCAEYDGSTTAGFSGAPYMYNNTVVGVHAFGGKVNGGSEILYLKAMHGINESIDLESSDEFFKSFIEDNEDTYIEEVGDDIIVTDDAGHYHVAKGELAKNVREARRKKKMKVYEPKDYQAEYSENTNSGLNWADETTDEQWAPSDYVGESARPSTNPFLGEGAGKYAPQTPRRTREQPGHNVTPPPLPPRKPQSPKGLNTWGGYQRYPYTGPNRFSTGPSLNKLVRNAVEKHLKRSTKVQQPTNQPTPAQQQ